MTNAEAYQQEAIEKLEQGKLNSYESEFVEKIREYSKKQLKRLTSKQFLFMRRIAEEK